MSEQQLNLLTVSEDRAGKEVTVQSTTASVGNSRQPGYVDEDGIVRQKENGAAFNGTSYEVVDQ